MFCSILFSQRLDQYAVFDRRWIYRLLCLCKMLSPCEMSYRTPIDNRDILTVKANRHLYSRDKSESVVRIDTFQWNYKKKKSHSIRWPSTFYRRWFLGIELQWMIISEELGTERGTSDVCSDICRIAKGTKKAHQVIIIIIVVYLSLAASSISISNVSNAPM